MTRERIRALLLAGGLLCGFAPLSGCATGGSVRHVATVSVVTAHSILAAIDDTENALVCGRATAPAPPLCVTQAKHQELSGLLVIAFDLDGKTARMVRALPDGAAQPAEVGEMLKQLQGIVTTVLAALPESPPKESLLKKLEAQ